MCDCSLKHAYYSGFQADANGTSFYRFADGTVKEVTAALSQQPSKEAADKYLELVTDKVYLGEALQFVRVGRAASSPLARFSSSRR